jgi:hypothetical protein
LAGLIQLELVIPSRAQPVAIELAERGKRPNELTHGKRLLLVPERFGLFPKSC